MTEISKELQNQVLTLVQQRKKVAIAWLASITLLTEIDIVEIASELQIEIDGEYLLALETLDIKEQKEALTKEDYDKLYPKPAPTFCEAKKSRKLKF